VVAVNKPAASFWPEARMQSPGTMSASTAVDVRMNVVVLETVTVRSPVGPVRIKDCPLICTSWPDAPLRNCPPPRCGLGELDAPLEAVAALPHAVATTANVKAINTNMRFMDTTPY
jgi:hypothetical protein